MIEPYTVLPYSDDNLATSLSNNLTSSDWVKNTKPHYEYLCKYLAETGGIGAKTIVIENKYLSKSYLIDYSNFYSTCFNHYERFCKRVHFFSDDFNKRKFTALIKNPGSKLSKIWDGYLGYIVIKPLPKVLIGATVLKTYQSTSIDKRYFPATKKYKVNIFGKELTIKSLAFQEQDTVVGACASSALWSAFNKTSQLFQTPLPSPSDITKSAKNLFYNSGRTYPNHELDHYQIGNAVDSIGLVSELRNSRNFSVATYLKAFIYSYNKIGLPVLLGIKLPALGGHLITITGFREENPTAYVRTADMALKADSIEKFYAHDDQVGPFTRLKIESSGKIETAWIDKGTGTNIIADFSSVFVPIFNKIRLTFENIYSIVRLIDFYFYTSLPATNIYWDIYLDFSNNYKMHVQEAQNISSSQKYKILIEPLPKYIWIAKGLVIDECVIELIFDATEIDTADFCIAINTYNTSLKTFLQANLLSTSIIGFFKNDLSAKYYDLMVESTK